MALRLVSDDSKTVMSDIIRCKAAVDKEMQNTQVSMEDLGVLVEQSVDKAQKIIEAGSDNDISQSKEGVEKLLKSFGDKARGGPDGAEWHHGLSPGATEQDVFAHGKATLMKVVGNASRTVAMIDDAKQKFDEMSKLYGKQVDVARLADPATDLKSLV